MTNNGPWVTNTLNQLEDRIRELESENKALIALNRQLDTLAKDCLSRGRSDVDRIEGLECMVKVFRGCINTQTFPARASRCHKIVHDLVGVYKPEENE